MDEVPSLAANQVTGCVLNMQVKGSKDVVQVPPVQRARGRPHKTETPTVVNQVKR
jgi:hypothetical protein